MPGFWPEAEWSRAAGRRSLDGFEARFAAVWWAIENGLTTEAADELRELHRLDPKHAPTARMATALDRLDQPCPDPDSAAFQKALGDRGQCGARAARDPVAPAFAKPRPNERIALLEKVITGFYLLFAAEGIELSTPRQRLVSAWFADKKDFLAFLHAEEADAFATTRGYFHPTWNAVVAFDARSTDQQQTREEKLAARRDELRRFGQQLDRRPARARIRIELGGEPVRTVEPFRGEGGDRAARG